MGSHGPMVPQGVHFGGATPGRARFFFGHLAIVGRPLRHGTDHLSCGSILA